METPLNITAPAGVGTETRRPNALALDVMRTRIKQILRTGATDLDANEEFELALWARLASVGEPVGAIEVVMLQELTALLSGLNGASLDEREDVALRSALIALDSSAAPGRVIHEMAQLAVASGADFVTELHVKLGLAPR